MAALDAAEQPPDRSSTPVSANRCYSSVVLDHPGGLEVRYLLGKTYPAETITRMAIDYTEWEEAERKAEKEALKTWRASRPKPPWAN